MRLLPYILAITSLTGLRALQCPNPELESEQLLSQQLPIGLLTKTLIELSGAHEFLGNNYPFVLMDADSSQEIKPQSCLHISNSPECQNDESRMRNHANLKYHLRNPDYQSEALDFSKQLNWALRDKRIEDRRIAVESYQELSQISSGLNNLAEPDAEYLDNYINTIFGKFLSRYHTARTNQPLACAEMFSISYMRLLRLQHDHNVEFPIHTISVYYNGEERKYDHHFLIINALLVSQNSFDVTNFDQLNLSNAFIVDPYWGPDFALMPADSPNRLNIHKATHASELKISALPSYQQLEQFSDTPIANMPHSQFFRRYIERALEISETPYNKPSF